MLAGAATIRSVGRRWRASATLGVLPAVSLVGLTSPSAASLCSSAGPCAPFAAPGAPAQAAFSWSLPERLAVGGSTVPIQKFDAAVGGSILFDGCSSRPDGSGVAAYRWTVDDGIRTRSYPTGQQCRLSLPRSIPNGTWTVGLTVTSRDGARATTTQAVHFRDLLIASLGDSAASGEGNPDTPAGVGHPVQWTDARCDRSGRAASAEVARRFAADPHTSVTFWHLACSGARIISDTPDDQRGGGVLSPFDGQQPPAGDHAPLPSQFEQLRLLARAAHRQVDALLLTVGANDTRWADVLFDCYVERIKILGSCEQKWEPTLRQRMALLPGRFDQVGATLRGERPVIDSNQRLVLGDGTLTVRPDRVFLTEYYNPTMDDRQGFWSEEDAGFSWYCPQDPLVPGPDTRRWGYETLVKPLNAAIGAAAAHNHWRLVGGISDAFDAHGYCAADSWIRSLPESQLQESRVFGAWHPNGVGQGVIAGALLAALMSTPGLG
jgi:hypothetical protein